jgi:hypothetical protein
VKSLSRHLTGKAGLRQRRPWGNPSAPTRPTVLRDSDWCVLGLKQPRAVFQRWCKKPASGIASKPGRQGGPWQTGHTGDGGDRSTNAIADPPRIARGRKTQLSADCESEVELQGGVWEPNSTQRDTGRQHAPARTMAAPRASATQGWRNVRDRIRSKPAYGTRSCTAGTRGMAGPRDAAARCTQSFAGVRET